MLGHKQPEKIARIYQQDKLLYEIDLSQVTQAYTITIDGENGAENVVLVEQGLELPQIPWMILRSRNPIC